MQKFFLLFILFLSTSVQGQGVFNIFEAMRSGGSSDSWLGAGAVTSWNVTNPYTNYGFSIEYRGESWSIDVGNNRNKSFFNSKLEILLPYQRVTKTGNYIAIPKIDTLGLPSLSVPYSLKSKSTIVGLFIGKDYNLYEGKKGLFNAFIGYSMGFNLTFYRGEFETGNYDESLYNLMVEEFWVPKPRNTNIGVLLGFKMGGELILGADNQLFFEAIPTYSLEINDSESYNFGNGSQFLLRSTLGFRFWL